jgi:hypothetical protein
MSVPLQLQASYNFTTVIKPVLVSSAGHLCLLSYGHLCDDWQLFMGELVASKASFVSFPLRLLAAL